MAKHEPAIEPDENAVALFGNAAQIVDLRRDEPTERSTELVEWLSSMGWARLVALVRSEDWETLWATLEALEIDAARTAMRWATIELARLS